ncbi:hypothetical protein nbrc107696_37070 [Gordonia spumicola]|uniref:Uncharacterized protein n=2 Tax=Gordonia spumicola TaxID=589161 RepID=A0A7I9VDN1_9ACTN|nr:hypothetical protein nbrc107696_37070 [Gordonia spumicola]
MPVDVRFHLPQGPQLPPKSWQRRYRWPIRVGSVVAVLVFVAASTVAIVYGFAARSTITASGAVTVDCVTRTAGGSSQIRFGAPVALYDADDTDGSPLATTYLDGLRRLGGDVCLADFEVKDLDSVPLYTVTIGDDFRALVSSGALEAGYLFA